MGWGILQTWGGGNQDTLPREAPSEPGRVFTSMGVRTNYHKTTHMPSLGLLQARSPKSRCCQGWFFGASEGE